MLDRRVRREGIRLIETALCKIASEAALPAALPAMAVLPSPKKDDPASATAVVPKVVSTPT